MRCVILHSVQRLGDLPLLVHDTVEVAEEGVGRGHHGSGVEFLRKDLNDSKRKIGVLGSDLNGITAYVDRYRV